jgi:hypothetical protein
VVGCCAHGNEASCSITEFLDKLNNGQLLWEDFAVWNQFASQL